jgi:ABC-type nitrate/sulfonate/bicarbonate transport system permease component
MISIKRLYRRSEAFILGGVGLLLPLLVWYYLAASGQYNPILISSPMRVLAGFSRQISAGTLQVDTLITLSEFAWGYGLSVLVGVPAGLLMGRVRVIGEAGFPLLWLAQAAPFFAFMPLLIATFGLGPMTVIAISFAEGIIPVVINTSGGVKNVQEDWISVGRTFGGTKLDVFRKIVLPGAMPSILAGLKLAVGPAMVGTIVGEMFGSTSGLGYRLVLHASRLRTDDMFVPLVTLGLLGLVLTQLVRGFDRLSDRWRA